MNPNPAPYGAYPQQPYPYIPYIPPTQPPQWADPVKLEQKAIRRSASRLAFAALSSLPLQILFANGAAILLLFCGVNLMFPGPNSIGGFPALAYYLIASMLSYVSIVLPYGLFLLGGRRRLVDTVLVEKTGVLNGLLLVLAGAFVCVIMNIPANLISALLEQLGLSGATNTDSLTVNSVTELIAMVVSVVLIAPVTEEFAFRGVTTAVLRRWGDWPAILFSGVIFGMAHYSFQALPVVMLGGIAMSFLYVRTRNIWISIGVHFLNNLFAVLPIGVNYLWGEMAANAVSVLSFYLIVVLGIIALVLLIIRQKKTRSVFRTPMQRGLAVPNKALHLFLNPGFIVYLLVFLVMSVVTAYVS